MFQDRLVPVGTEGVMERGVCEGGTRRRGCDWDVKNNSIDGKKDFCSKMDVCVCVCVGV